MVFIESEFTYELQKFLMVLFYFDFVGMEANTDTVAHREPYIYNCVPEPKKCVDGCKKLN